MWGEKNTDVSLPSPPFVEVDGIANFRDIGGYPCALPQNNGNSLSITDEDKTNKGKLSIRRDLVFRCADPTAVRPTGLDKLHQLGIKKAFDLRSWPEIQREGPEWAGLKPDQGAFVTRKDGEGETAVIDGQIERIWCPVFSDADYGPEKVALRYAQYARSGSEGFVQAYKDILAAGGPAYKTILTHLASVQGPEPCIVHCSAGKDRTGVLVALLYLLCGVPRDVVASEYSLTDLGLAHMKPLFMQRLLLNPVLAGNEDGVRNMVASRAENMSETIGMIEREYGSAEAYVREVVGLSGEEVERLRGNLMTSEAPVLS